MSVPQLYRDLYDNDVFLRTRRRIAFYTGSEERTTEIMNTLTDMSIALCRNPGARLGLVYLDTIDDSFEVWNCGRLYAAWWIRRIAEETSKHD